MKQKLLLFLLATSLVLFTLSCKSGDGAKGSAEAKELLKALNKSQLGVTIKVDEDNMVTEASGDRYLITFKDPQYEISAAAYKGTPLHGKMKGMDFDLKMAEMTYLYGPKEKYLEFVGMKGFSVDIDFAAPQQEKIQPVNMKINISADGIQYKNYIVSTLLEAKARNFVELLADYLKDSPKYQTEITSGRYDIGVMAGKDSYVTFQMSAARLLVKQNAMSDAFLFIYRKGPVPDFKDLVKKGKPIFDFHVALEDLTVSVKKDLQEMGGLSLGSYSLTCGLHPDSDNSVLNFVLKDSMKGFQVRVPSKREIEPFLDIPQVDSEFSLNRLNPDCLTSMIRLIKMGMEFDNQEIKKREDLDKIKMDAMQMGEKFLETKPEITFKLAPFKHHFGELSMEAQCVFNNSIIPEIRGEIKLKDLEVTLDMLKKEKLIPAEVVEKMAQGIRQTFVKNDAGEPVMTIEFKPPRTLLINGKPVNR